MNMHTIDSKFHIDENCNIVKTSNGEVISRDEPTFIFRARDYLAVPLLIKYRDMCIADGCTQYQLEKLTGMIETFAKFATDHPEEMKQPGITRGL